MRGFFFYIQRNSGVSGMCKKTRGKTHSGDWCMYLFETLIWAREARLLNIDLKKPNHFRLFKNHLFACGEATEKHKMFRFLLAAEEKCLFYCV